MVQRFLSVAICGIPNAGKSSLLNELLLENVVGVSPKVQTTRSNVRGVLTQGDTQLVFVDTPGIFLPKRLLERKIVRNANNGISSAEVICLIIDAKRGLDKTSEDLLRKFKQEEKKVIAVINKIDLVKESVILDLGNKIFSTGYVDEQFFISALKGRGVENLKEHFFSLAKEDSWWFNAEQKTDKDETFLASEITRARLFYLLAKELPYGINVVTEQVFDNGIDLEIHQTILTNQSKHKAMIIGKGGGVLRRVSGGIMEDLENLFARKVRLKLFVKVKEDWIENWDGSDN